MFWVAFLESARRTGLTLSGDPHSERGDVNSFVILDL